MINIRHNFIVEQGYEGKILLSFNNSDVNTIKEGKIIDVWIRANLDDSELPQGRLVKYEVNN